MVIYLYGPAVDRATVAEILESCLGSAYCNLKTEMLGSTIINKYLNKIPVLLLNVDFFFPTNNFFFLLLFFFFFLTLICFLMLILDMDLIIAF